MRILADEKGSAAIFLALFLTALIGTAALVTDVGLLYVTRMRLVNMADAAALAGAQEMPEDAAKARTVALEYLASNGIEESDTVEILTSSSNRTIQVKIKRKVHLLFAKVLGVHHSVVEASAKAKVGAPKGLTGVAPLGISNQTLQFGKLYSLKVGSPPTLAAGFFGALTLGKPGASSYEHNLKYGYQGTLSVGDVVDTESGNMSGPTSNAISYRVDQDPTSTIYDFSRDSTRIILVPVYEPYQVENDVVYQVKIIGFASFLLDSSPGNGKDNWVNGYFIRNVAVADTTFTENYYGLKVVKLVE